MALYTSDWTPINDDTFFRRHELYPMSWAECDWTERTLVCVASSGGPIAVCRDVSNSAVPIMIYNGAGESLGLAKWNGQLAGAGWSDDERLVLVDAAGQVSVYDMFGKMERSLSLGQEVKKFTVESASVFLSHQGTGLAVLCRNQRFYMTTSLEQPLVKKLPDAPGGSGPPSCWVTTADRYRSAVLVAKGLEVSLLEADSKAQPLAITLPAAAQRVTQLVTNRAGDLLAALTDSGHLVLTSLDLRQTFCTVDTGARQPAKQLQWCGSYAVVGYWNSSLLVVNRRGETIKYGLDVPGQLCAECDCIRLVTPYSHELIEQVWSDSVAVFRIGSMDPAAVLVETHREYEKRSHLADEYLRMILTRLNQAVTSCIEAAGHEHNPQVQKLLLRAAQYGKSFVSELDPELFVSTCRYLRVLNSLRHHSHGMPLTMGQLRQMPVPALLDRLMRRRLHFLALRVCRQLQPVPHADQRRVLEAWAKHLVVSSDGEGQAVARQIADRLGSQSGISFADVAKTAIAAGKRGTAIQLLAMEQQARRTVPLLIDLNMCDEALKRAADSGDPDLAHSALLQLRDARGRAEFQMLIRNYPLMQSLYMKYLRSRGQTELVRDGLIQEDDFDGQARLRIAESYKETRVDLRISHLVAAQDCYKKAKNEFWATQTEDQHKLLKYQSSLEESCNREYVGLSLQDTIKQLILSDRHKLADSLRNEYKISDKRFWWTKLLALAEGEQWTELEKFAKSKKSPVGYEPFVDACLEHGSLVEAKKYLPRVNDENKVKYYAKAGLLEDAARIAFEQRDRDALAYVEGLCGPNNRSVLQQIGQYRQTLKP
ncbi:vacuolar protein sorting-associated protein 16 homolog [Amphibalanus amphitrite]|uniref:vacuolar protein sorting-associated protein 16 homolog n=1 Tax=Amphibalanus amphitrite TaxID=1232801 RepID=UPI001C90BC2D|nr:vacuolar protein sorting-associated protein 16 homolog [Amphibalanus amphitrite]XP_043223807.1 vacuolar protein sorting-associated protein 16 homolog [Amphibalanus amphitrite]XP_043223808.1 vacuolar protein sorting-associated protein 16 homolog [Amphibalanus amphitrite]XP_043223809.1 vacuolar protein sorting-associated protein 16 homolog [Amphibalanus amphitrite]